MRTETYLSYTTKIEEKKMNDHTEKTAIEKESRRNESFPVQYYLLRMSFF